MTSTQAVAADDQSIATGADEPSVGKGAVLVVDDDADMRELIQEVLVAEGFSVDVEPDGASALTRLGAAEYDAVVSDVRMPGIGGLELLRAVQDRSPGTEVVLASAFASLETAIEALRNGAFDFVQKPFNVEELATTVARAVERKRLRAASALYQASQAVFACLEHQRLPQVIVEVAMKVMAADDVSLMLPDSDGRLYLRHSHAFSPEVQAAARVAIGEGVAGRVAASGKPALLPDGLLGDPRFPGVKSFGRVRSSIVYPLLSGDRLAGVLNISRVENQRPYRKSDLERASILASQVLLAIENGRLVKQLVMAERLASLGQIAAGVAHEINNPVAYVGSGASFIREQLDQLEGLSVLFEQGGGPESLRSCWQEIGGRSLLDETRQALAEVLEGTERIRDIVGDLRSLSRGGDPEPKWVDLNEVVRSALRVAGAEVRHRARVNTQLGDGVHVSGNPGRLCQVLINLLVNAAQAIGDGHADKNEISVSTRNQGEQVILQVSDTGPGIAPEHLPRIFEPFFTTKGATTGTGLGLAISRDIARRHGGEMRVESVPDKGATFTLTLPAASGSGA